jgi:hypothetical protein
VKDLLLFLSFGLLVVSLIATELSVFFQSLGFKEEADSIFSDALAIAVLGFALFMVSYPRVEYRSPNVDMELLY